MRQRLQLRGQRRGGHLRHHQPRLQPAVAREERRQAAERRIDQPFGPPLADRRQLGEAEAQQIGGHRHRRAVKLPPETISRVSANTIGLSVAALASIGEHVVRESAGRRAPRRAPAARSASNRRPARGRSWRARR